MGVLARSWREVILFYNPESSIAKKTLAYAKAEGYPLRDVDIIKTSFTGTQLEELADLLKVPISGLVNKEHPDFKTHFGDPDLTDEGWIKLLKKNPHLIKEPIVVKGDIAFFIKEPSDVIPF